jgi:hypothetical protein
MISLAALEELARQPAQTKAAQVRFVLEKIEAARAQGHTWAVIARELTNAGLPVSGIHLAGIVSRARKQTGRKVATGSRVIPYSAQGKRPRLSGRMISSSTQNQAQGSWYERDEFIWKASGSLGGALVWTARGRMRNDWRRVKA